MDIKFSLYRFLPHEAKDIRQKVFVEEQGFQEEFDGIDKIATHIVAFCKDEAVATCRFFAQDKYFLIGRIAVILDYRSKGVGRKIIEYAEEQISACGGSQIRIHAQAAAENFYKKLGYLSIGDYDFEEDCKHIWMIKYLQ